MPFSSKTSWMIQHPAWPWFVFTLNTLLIALAFVSIIVLGAQQQYLVREVGEIDRKLVQAFRINQSNVDIVAKKAGVPKHKIQQPDLPVLTNMK